MADEFTMPKLGLTMTEGIIREWLVPDGTPVRAGQPVLLIETDKVETEIEARTDGILRVTGIVGSTYECGDVIGYFFDEDDTVTGAVPPVGPDVDEPSLFEDRAPLAEVVPLTPAVAAASSAEPVAQSAPGEATPPVEEVVAPTARAPVEEPASIAPEPAVSAPATMAVPPAEPVSLAARGEHGRILASPRARATALAIGIALDSVAGTGPGGRIRHDDVVAAGERAETERRNRERAEQERLAAERAQVERAEQERLAAERAQVERAEQERLAAERAQVERAEQERLAAERAQVERAEQERLAAERAQVERAEQERDDERPTAELERIDTEWGAGDEATAQPSRFTLVTPPEVAAIGDTRDRVPATAGARLLADFLGVDLAEIPASAGQKLSREDVGTWVRERLRTAPLAAPSEDAPGSAPALRAVPLLQEPTAVIPLKGMRGIIAERMHGSLREMAQLTLSVDVDMSGINEEREARRRRGETVPGYTAWVVAAAAQALNTHPYVNSQITDEGLALLPDVHVGVAVALDDGLIVPVIEHADVRSVEETHQVVADLAVRARNRKLELKELEGSTFSVTALGMFGVDMFTPVINPPNTAILGVGRLRSETTWREGQPAERTVMTLSLTWDHRAFDGAPAAEFAQTIVRALEAPAELV